MDKELDNCGKLNGATGVALGSYLPSKIFFCEYGILNGAAGVALGSYLPSKMFL